MPRGALSAWECRNRLAQAQGRVSVQADCSPNEALALMVQRAELSGRTLDQIADDVCAHRDWFRPIAK